MHGDALRSAQSFAGKYFKVTVEQDHTPLGTRAYVQSTAGEDMEMLLQGRGLDITQLMELSVLSAMASVVVGLQRANDAGL